METAWHLSWSQISLSEPFPRLSQLSVVQRLELKPRKTEEYDFLDLYQPLGFCHFLPQLIKQIEARQVLWSAATALLLLAVALKACSTLCNRVPAPPVRINSTPWSPSYLINGSAQTSPASCPQWSLCKVITIYFRADSSKSL